ncbi:WhiB family transcriptional regulator [Streptomyces sp. NPDC002889]|uniref:WhiB family transcriptional regulator n=1 Tax=Streptomyces sp. NPDC002889 TaxID=3364669 RepID=UPI0036C05B25
MYDVPSFLDDAAAPLPCRADPELFFAEDKTSREDAARICQGCPFRGPCAAYALERPQLRGVWGGLSRWRRSQLRG